LNYVGTFYFKKNTVKDGNFQYAVLRLDILNTVLGNEGYPSEGLAVFGLHSV
jgi:hypothetical protein